MPPRSLAARLVRALVAGGLRLLDRAAISFLIGLPIGPFLGGVLLRSRWWIVIAAAVGSSLVAGGAIRPLYVALPVALIASLGTRFQWPLPPRPDNRSRVRTGRTSDGGAAGRSTRGK